MHSTMSEESRASRKPLALPLTLAAMRVLTQAVEEGYGDQLKITLPEPEPDVKQPFMLIPFEICARIMRTYTEESGKEKSTTQASL